MSAQVEKPIRETRSAEGQAIVTTSVERVWQALTDARELERWFPLDARVEPGPDGSVWMSWRNEFAADMKILVWDPPRHLRTAWSFHRDDQPAQITDYTIESRGGVTVIRAVTSGFPLDAGWDGWVEGTVRGWAFELRSLKHYLERHAGEPRHVAYLRRRILLPRDEAWARLAGAADLVPWMTGGDVFDEHPGRQRAAIVADPADGLFRVSIEPPAPGTSESEVVLWLSAWGSHGSRVQEISTRWERALERLFPEGRRP